MFSCCCCSKLQILCSWSPCGIIFTKSKTISDIWDEQAPHALLANSKYRSRHEIENVHPIQIWVRTVICSWFPSVMDFTSKKIKSDAHFLLLPPVTTDFTSEKGKSDAHLLLLPPVFGTPKLFLLLIPNCQPQRAALILSQWSWKSLNLSSYHKSTQLYLLNRHHSSLLQKTLLPMGWVRLHIKTCRIAP